MNVCIEAQTLNHHRRSGLMTYTEGLVNSLYSHDQENAYTLLYYSLTRSASQMPGPERANFKKVVLKAPDREFWARQSLIDHVVLPRYLKENEIKVFHRANGYTMPAGDIFRVLTVHDLRTLTIGDTLWAQNIDHYKKTLDQVDMCVVVSECTKQDLIRHFKLDEKKIRVIYLGADKRFQPADPKVIETVKAKYNIREPFLLSIGSVPRKNIDGIIRGFAASRARDNFLLVLSCNTDIETYQGLAKELGVERRLVILDKLSDEDVVSLYSACHGFVFPSLYEGFGLPIVEAMQCGAPVITSNVSSCPEVAGDAAILVDPKNAGQLAEAIDQVCHRETLRQDLIRKGFERAKLFDWDRYAGEIKKVYSLA